MAFIEIHPNTDCKSNSHNSHLPHAPGGHGAHGGAKLLDAVVLLGRGHVLEDLDKLPDLGEVACGLGEVEAKPEKVVLRAGLGQEAALLVPVEELGVAIQSTLLPQEQRKNKMTISLDSARISPLPLTNQDPELKLLPHSVARASFRAGYSIPLALPKAKSKQ